MTVAVIVVMVVIMIVAMVMMVVAAIRSAVVAMLMLAGHVQMIARAMPIGVEPSGRVGAGNGFDQHASRAARERRAHCFPPRNPRD